MHTQFRTRLPTTLPPLLASDDFPNCFLVARRDFERIHGFDAERYPTHYEESDLARRLMASTGRGVFCVPSAKVWHFISPDITGRLHIKDPVRAYWLSHGRAAFTSTYGTRLQRVAYLTFGRWFYAVVYIAATLGLPPTLRRRVAAAYLDGLRKGGYLFRTNAVNPSQ